MSESQNSILLALRKIIQEVSSKKSFEDAINTLVDLIRDATNADCCSLYLLSSRKSILKLAATEGLQKDSIGKATLQIGEGLVGLVAQKQELINLANAPDHPNFKYLPDVGEDEYQSFLGVPVINQGELLGVLVIQCKENRVFGEQEETLLITLSAQIASIISITRTIKENEDFRVSRYKGKTGSGSIAIAQAVVWKPPVTFETIQIMYSDEKDIQSELFHQTIFQLQMEMDRANLYLQENSHSKASSGYMSGYGIMLDDPTFEDEVDNEIFENGYVAASAIKVVTMRRIKAAENDGYKEKIRDMRDFASILITRLVHLAPKETELSSPVVLVVQSMPAALVAEMTKDKIAGFICIDSATSSHTAILARDLGIPAVIGVNIDINDVDGRTIIVDGQNAEVLIDPSSSLIDEYMQLIAASKKQNDLFNAGKYEKAVTQDNKEICIQLNAGLNHDDDDLPEQTDGIGLYRTEISFMLCDSLPSEDQQVGWYRNLLSQFKGLPVCMRTLDVGGDKSLSYLPIEENNPALGWRGVRVCIDQPNILKTQLRAMLIANKDFGNLEIMIPMVSRLEEVVIVKRLLNEAIYEIEEETGAKIPRPRFGVMIEVPCVAFMLDELASECDFFSIGSNDLISYLFAADRANPKVSKLFDAFNPAAVRCFKYLIDRANSLQRPIAVCGEIAGSPIGCMLLMSLGYTRLSMNYSQISMVKYIVKNINLQDLQSVGKQAMALNSSVKIKQLYIEYAKSKGLYSVIDTLSLGKNL